MSDEYNHQETKAPFNMAIATLMSLRQTLDMIRNIENQNIPTAEERQRIKVELVKRFYVDSSPLLPKPEKFKEIIMIVPHQIMFVDRHTQKQTKRTKYSVELNQKLDTHLLNLQIELQKGKFFMPPSDDLGSIGMKMS